jgi:hypothetical protein
VSHVQDANDPTGIAQTGIGAHSTRARERKQNAALQMKLAGATWQEVAEVIGYPTARQAIVAVEQSLERELAHPDSQAQLRAMAGKRLERLLRSTWPKALNDENPEHLQAVGKAREILGDYAKLFGLNAPTEVTVHNPTTAELDKWVASVTAANAPPVTEYDIIAGEIEEALSPEEQAVEDGMQTFLDTYADDQEDDDAVPPRP